MGLFDFLKKKDIHEKKADEIGFDSIMQEAVNECLATKQVLWDIKVNNCTVFSNKILCLNADEKAAFIQDSVLKIHEYFDGRRSFSSTDPQYYISMVREAFMRHLLKTKMELSEDHIRAIYSGFINYNGYYTKGIFSWPIALFITQIERQAKGKKLSETFIKLLEHIKGKVSEKQYYSYEKEKVRLIEKLDTLIFNNTNTSGEVKPVYFLADDFGKFANEFIDNSSEKERYVWFKLLSLSFKAQGGKPSNKYIEDGTKLYKELGPDKFKKVVNAWMEFIIKFKERAIHGINVYNGTEYPYTVYEYIAPTNLDIMKGFVWLYTNFYDKTTLFAIATLAEKSYRKIPGKGPAAAGLGNACLYVLSETRGLDGIGHLSRLKLSIKQNNTRKTIDAYLVTAAEKIGVTIAEIEELAVDDYDLSDGSKTIEFGDYVAKLELNTKGKANIFWFNIDGVRQKSVPAAVKQQYKDKLKKINGHTKQIETSINAQKNRIDGLFKTDRKLSWEKFEQFYFLHGLVSCLAKNMIWSFIETGITIDCIWSDGAWRNNNDEPIQINIQNTMVCLWHPVNSTVTDIIKWRNYLEDKLIQQPIKQAFREVYILTDAEINTRTYSNRMAAHILKQHQFSTLTNIRGWKYSLLGAYDDGRFNEAASIALREFGISAEFWINEVNADDAYNDAGIWNYVSTDQVRFVDTNNNITVPLVEIPKIIFSEIMRDVDLFVGVASVGNDPTWSDTGGIPAYRDYWQSYSFGDLSEVAKTRKGVLQKLLPKLKIAACSYILDKFLVVKGKIRTYKIHIGSTNILMEPNDQYLCIVPDRGKFINDNLFLPFEGDAGLSVVISKAFLLAEDDKITDTTITNQINKK